MHLLFIGFVWPEPTSSAAGQNIVSYIAAARKYNWSVSFCSAAQETVQTHNLAQMGVNTFAVALNCSSFNKQIAELQPNVVIFDRYLSFEQFAWRVKQTLPDALLVLDAEDLHCLRIGRQSLVNKMIKQSNTLSFMQSRDICEPNNRALLYNETALREIACILQADLTLVLSDFEEYLLSHFFHVPKQQVVHIPFLLNTQTPAASDHTHHFQSKHDFVFIGNFRHAPNYHAVKILAEQCWPSIYNKLHKAYPNIACHVYGAYMPAKAKQLENKKIRFFVHGFAADQFSVIKQARVMLAPISFGAGVKGKLLDAMVCDTPSITTPLGAEGISHKKWPGFIANTIDEFIAKAIALYTDEETWLSCNNNGHAIINECFNLSVNRALFESTLTSKLNNLTNDRQSNFLQSMLSHHQFQSSKYMSQWIEAKNK